MGIMSFIEVSAFAVMTFFIAKFGTLALAAHQITFQFLGLMITFVFAMSQAVTVRVGHAVGAVDRSSVVYAIVTGLLLNKGIVFVMAFLIWRFADPLIALDVNTHHVNNISLVAQATNLFHVVAILLVFDNFRIIGFGALRGIKDTKFPMLSSLIAFWIIGLGLGLIFNSLYHAHTVGMWLGMSAGISVGAIIVVWRLVNRLKHIDLHVIRAVA